MGKNLIQQARGKGSPTYRAPSFKYKAKVFYPQKAQEFGKIVDLVKCRGHSSPLAKIRYDSGEETYVIAAEGVRMGDVVNIGNATPDNGNTLFLKDVPVGTSLFNIELKPGDGGKFVRSGGCFARVLSKKEDEIVILLPSKKQKSFHPKCRATVGVVAGSGRKDKPFVKAGTKYHYMKSRNKLYPKTSGIAMNAVDHPHGTSRSSKKGHPTIARKNAPPGAKVGKIRPRRTGRVK